jgi:hypothetical protein
MPQESLNLEQTLNQSHKKFKINFEVNSIYCLNLNCHIISKKEISRPGVTRLILINKPLLVNVTFADALIGETKLKCERATPGLEIQFINIAI